MNDRHHTVAEIIREQAALFVRNEANTNPLITITREDVAPNFRAAIILFTTIPAEREADALIFLQRHAREMRGAIKKNTSLKYLPLLSFAVDNGERHRQHIDELINEHIDHTTTETDPEKSPS